jgi:4-amino-4-deoxy-L-arabinose transferase-like glycosyltransferase
LLSLHYNWQGDYQIADLPTAGGDSGSMVDTGSRRWLMAILILAASARLLVVLLFLGDYRPADDAAQYQRAAQNFLDGRGLIVNEDLKAYRTPLPSLYIAAIYAVSGPSVRAVQIANVFLGVFTVWLVYDLVRRSFGIIPARWSALCVSLYPLLLFYTGTLLSETLGIMLLALALWLVWLLRNKSAIWFAPVGVVLGLTALTRQTALPIAVVIVLWTVVGRQAAGWRRRLSPALIILTFMAVTLTPWAVRNYLVLGKFVPLTSQGGGSLWVANNPMADGTGSAEKFLLIPEVHALPEAERGAAYQKLAVQFIREDPLRFAQLALRRLLYFWHLGYHGEGRAEIAFLVVYVPMLSLAALGVWRGWRLNRDAILLLLVIPVTLTLVHLVFLPAGRYRLPAELALCTITGVGAAWSFSKVMERLKLTMPSH